MLECLVKVLKGEGLEGQAQEGREKRHFMDL